MVEWVFEKGNESSAFWYFQEETRDILRPTQKKEKRKTNKTIDPYPPRYFPIKNTYIYTQIYIHQGWMKSGEYRIYKQMGKVLEKK